MSAFDFVYLMGHRATGKTTTGEIAARRMDWEFVDLDEMIETITGESCADIIADSEQRFRRVERQTLDALRTRRRVSGNTPCIIALGGGFRPLPEDGLRIWMYREGWRHTARQLREPLQRNRNADVGDELDEMERQREPRWEASAHLKLHVSRGRPVDRAARELQTLIQWSADLPDERYCPKTWLTPTTRNELKRAARDCNSFGLAGIELRSDQFDSLEASDADAIEGTPLLASLRTDDPEWIPRIAQSGHVQTVDIDLECLEATLEVGALNRVDASTIVVSSHPERATDRAFEALLSAGDALADAGVVARDHIVLKYAPQIQSVEQLRAMFEHRRQAIRDGWDVTVLPQGPEYRWLRPILAETNATNYMPVGFDPLRRTYASGEPRPQFDLQRWLPHLAGPTPEVFDGLIGKPVEHSQGDVWHRRAALANVEDEVSRSYLKIPVEAPKERGELEDILRLLHDVGIRGLSVTAPLKRRVVEARSVEARGFEAANTLYRASTGEGEPRWKATDTDAEGMRRCLRTLEDDHDIGPGGVAVIGTGGVAPAIRRAIEASDWELVVHARGRDGWSNGAVDGVDLIVNAAGDHDSPYVDPPPSTAWLDLHYRDVRRPPETTEVHLNGDTFFDGQAEAQRRVWAEHPHSRQNDSTYEV